MLIDGKMPPCLSAEPIRGPKRDLLMGVNEVNRTTDHQIRSKTEKESLVKPVIPSGVEGSHAARYHQSPSIIPSSAATRVIANPALAGVPNHRPRNQAAATNPRTRAATKGSG